MTELYGRNVELELIGQEVRTSVKGLHVSFKVRMDDEEEANEAVITIHNLSATKRAAFSKSYNYVILKAGYNTPTPIIFTGEIETSESLRGISGWETTFLATDALAPVRNNWFKKSYTEGASLADIANDVISALRVHPIIGNIDVKADTKQLTNLKIKSGVTYNAKAIDVLKKVAKRVNYHLSIQLGAIIFKPAESVKKGIGAKKIVLRSGTGLLEHPEINQDGEVTTRTLIVPGLEPTATVTLEAEAFKTAAQKEDEKKKQKKPAGINANGDYIVKRVDFDGANFGQSFYAVSLLEPITA